jgi:c(7)-type cytochrome triheme protein
MKAVTLVLAIIIAVALVGTAMAVSKGKTIEYAGGPMGKVVFDGTTHAEKGLMCGKCHTDPFGPPAPHKERMKMTMEDHDAGKLCFKCHNGTDAFASKDNCAKCHKK